MDVEGQRRLFRSRGSPGWPAVVDAVQEASVGGGDGESLSEFPETYSKFSLAIYFTYGM